MTSVNEKHDFSAKTHQAKLEAIRILGFAFLLEWFSASGFLASSAAANRSDFLTLVIFTGLLFCTALRSHNHTTVAFNLKSLPILGTAAAIGTIVPSLVENSVVVAAVCPSLSAIGLATLVLKWGSLFSKQPMEIVVIETIIAQMVMSILHLLNCFIPPFAGAIIRGASLVASSILLAVSLRRDSLQRSEGAASGSNTYTPVGKYPFIRFIIAINLWALAINQLYNIYRYCAPLDFADLSAPAALVEVAFLGCLLAAANIRTIKDSQLYTIIFSAALLAFLLIPVLGIKSPVPFYALFLGFASLSILTWILSAQICQKYSCSPTAVYGFAIGSFLGLQIIIARVIAQDVFSEIASAPAELNALCLVGAFLSFGAYQLVFNRQSAIWPKSAKEKEPLTGDNTAKRSLNADPAYDTDPFDRWNDFAQLFHLTPRESEVLLLFARGRSYERIQETLVISRGTVNYHMSNAYKKIGISSRQELLDKLDAMPAFIR